MPLCLMNLILSPDPCSHRPLFCRASLPVILSLLSLWLVLFIFFAILFVEVFGLTKWNTAESRNQNYSAMSKALVMLAFMTSGYVLLGCSRVARFLPEFAAVKAGINTCTTSKYSLLQSFLSLSNQARSTITYPRCTDSSPAEQDSDCGSVGWAYTLFIAWNILSMVSCSAFLLRHPKF